jgi:alpha-L-rhamnosidase
VDKSGSTLTLNVTVPPNATGVVYVPGSDSSSVKVSDAPNATFIGRQGSRLVYNVDSGSYSFTVSNR